MKNSTSHPLAGWRVRAHEIIFEADTPAGKAFDVVLIVCILGSVAVVMADSMAPVVARHKGLLNALEWFFTILFTMEYVLRLLVIGSPARYAASFFGVVDLLAVLPTYVSLLFPGAQYLMVIRALRVLRIFRVLKLARYVSEARMLMAALRASRTKITIFMFAVVTLVVILGSLMYVIEEGQNGFDSIPKSVYWAVVTLTTVGYGDISPRTALGQFLAAVMMLIGYAIIAVPTGIVSVEIARRADRRVSTQACPSCGAEGHETDARFCNRCGTEL